jgi:hypothetical protein
MLALRTPTNPCKRVYSCRTMRVRLWYGGVRQGQGARFWALRCHGPLLQAPVQGWMFRNQNWDCAPARAEEEEEKSSTAAASASASACEATHARARNMQSANPIPMPIPISVPVPVPVPKPTANVSIQLRYAALPVPLLQAAAMSDTTTTMSAAAGVQEVPDMDAVPVPRLPVGRLLRGDTRPQLRCHVIANCCRRGAAAGCCNCNLMTLPFLRTCDACARVYKRSVKAPVKKKRDQWKRPVRLTWVSLFVPGFTAASACSHHSSA